MSLSLILSLAVLGQANWQVPPANDWNTNTAYRVNIYNSTPWALEVQVQIYNPSTMVYEQKNYSFAPNERAFLGATPSRYFLFRARTLDGQITWTGPNGSFKQEDMGPKYTNWTETLRYVPDSMQASPPPVSVPAPTAPPAPASLPAPPAPTNA